jgi:hypothetical protein
LHDQHQIPYHNVSNTELGCEFPKRVSHLAAHFGPIIEEGGPDEWTSSDRHFHSDDCLDRNRGNSDSYVQPNQSHDPIETSNSISEPVIKQNESRRNIETFPSLPNSQDKYYEEYLKTEIGGPLKTIPHWPLLPGNLGLACQRISCNGC